METITLVVPSAQAGAILGQGGSRIKEIRASSECDVSIQKGAAGVVLRRVEMRGENAAAALQLVLESGTPESLEENVTQQLMISPSYVGAVVGKGGETIQRLRREHPGVIIDMEKHVGNASDRVLSFSGPAKELNEIILEVVDMIGKGIRGGTFKQVSGNKRQRSITNGGRGDAFDSFDDGPRRDERVDNELQSLSRKPRLSSNNAERLQGTLSVSVAKEQAGKIIGRRGATINQIRNESRCKVELEPDNSGTHRKLEIIGPLDGLDLACRLINGVVEGTMGTLG